MVSFYNQCYPARITKICFLFNHTQNTTLSLLSCHCKRQRGSREVGAGIFGRAQCTLFAVPLFSSISASRQYLHRKQCVQQSLGVTSRQHHGDKPPQETNHLWHLVSSNVHTCVENGREKKVLLIGGTKTSRISPDLQLPMCLVASSSYSSKAWRVFCPLLSSKESCIAPITWMH